jgi:hypothetical protein
VFDGAADALLRRSEGRPWDHRAGYVQRLSAARWRSERDDKPAVILTREYREMVRRQSRPGYLEQLQAQSAEYQDAVLVHGVRNLRALVRRTRSAERAADLAILEAEVAARGLPPVRGWRQYPRSLTFGVKSDSEGVRPVDPPPQKRRRKPLPPAPANPPAGDLLDALQAELVRRMTDSNGHSSNGQGSTNGSNGNSNGNGHSS